MPYGIVQTALVPVWLRCDNCGFEDRYHNQPLINPIRDAASDGWVFHGAMEEVAVCFVCNERKTPAAGEEPGRGIAEEPRSESGGCDRDADRETRRSA